MSRLQTLFCPEPDPRKPVTQKILFLQCAIDKFGFIEALGYAVEPFHGILLRHFMALSG
jgi:hypothetical protein